MAALIEFVFVCGVVLWVTLVVQTHARWRREQPKDQAWVDQLKAFNNGHEGKHRSAK